MGRKRTDARLATGCHELVERVWRRFCLAAIRAGRKTSRELARFKSPRSRGLAIRHALEAGLKGFRFRSALEATAFRLCDRFSSTPRGPAVPLTAGPGTWDRIQQLAARYQANEDLFSALDPTELRAEERPRAVFGRYSRAKR